MPAEHGNLQLELTPPAPHRRHPGFNLILPSADLALAAGESQFSGDGLIPD
jgi:hypothetical protein